MSQKNEQDLKKQLTELDSLLEWFERADFDLDEAVVKFEEGVKLAESIRSRLNEIENKISILKERFDKASGE